MPTSPRSSCQRARRSVPWGTVLLVGAALFFGAPPSTAGQQNSAYVAQAAPRPGPTNSLTDVSGLKVGHFQRTDAGFLTGTTVILAVDGATAGVSVLGGAPGTRETDLLAPGGLVTQAHAIVLSGGSAYGLDAASGVMRWLEDRGIGYPVRGGVVPIVPAAILFDLGRGGDFQARPDASFGYGAADAAHAGAVEQGRVGAGTGARHGLGTASVLLPGGYTVGAIVALNPAGSPVDGTRCVPLGAFLELDGEFGLSLPAFGSLCQKDESGRGPILLTPDGDAFNTTIAVVATDAPLDQTQAQRMALIANSGLARSIRPVHNLGDGDVVFGLATTPPAPPGTLEPAALQEIYNAAADALGRAVVHALLHHGEYCATYPEACGPR